MIIDNTIYVLYKLYFLVLLLPYVVTKCNTTTGPVYIVTQQTTKLMLQMHVVTNKPLQGWVQLSM